jgi:nitrate reductase NapA
MIEVARRLGLSDLFPYEPGRQVEQIWEEYGRFHSDAGSALPPMSALRAQAGALWPHVDGRGTRWRFNTAQDPAADPARGAFDFYGHEDHRAWIWLRPHVPAVESPDEAYPLWLVAGSVLEHWGGGAMTRRIPTLQRALPHGYVEINREDAGARGIRNGELVRLVSRRGAIELAARIDYRSQPPRGQLFAPWFDERMPVHRLFGETGCPLSGQPDSRKCAVRVERLSAGRNG